MRAFGELVAKVASVAFYVAIARVLGEDQFGDFIFGLSLSGVLFTLAAFGTDELLARGVARDPDSAGSMFGDALSLRALMLALLIGVIAAIVLLGGYSAEARIAILLVSVGVAFETLSRTYYAVFQGRERNQFIALSLIVQRLSTAVVGVVLLALGADLIAVALVFVAGAMLGLAISHYSLVKRVGISGVQVARERWIGLIKRGVPLGLAVALYAALLKIDVVLLSFLRGSDNAEVGIYGAAFRLVEATMFITWAFGGAMLPWFSQQETGARVSLVHAYELGLKVMTAMLLPIGAVFCLYAEPLIELIYGPQYEAAVTPLRLLALMTVLFGINSFIAILLIARDRPGDFSRPAAIVVVQNLAFNLILIPPLGADGAAINAVVSGVLLAVLAQQRAGRTFGSISLVRAFGSPVVATAAMVGIAFATGLAFTIPALLATGVTYVVGFLAAERLWFAGDFEFYRGALRRARGQGAAALEELPTPGTLEG